MSFFCCYGNCLEIQRALHLFLGFARDAMQIDHRRSDVRVAKEHLDRAEVVTRLKQVRGITMAKGVRGDAFRQFRLSDRFIQRILNMRFMKVIPPQLLRLGNERQ